jgi:hypothetical protein
MTFFARFIRDEEQIAGSATPDLLRPALGGEPAAREPDCGSHDKRQQQDERHAHRE